MGTFKVKSKYYIYGLVLGTVFAVLCQAIWIECSLIDLNSLLSGTIIDMAVFAAFFAVRFLYIRRSQWKKLLRRYFQQQTYCFVFLMGFLIAIGFYKVILAPYMAEIDFFQWREIFQYVFLAILGGLAVTFATAKENVSDSTGETNEADYLMDREINNFKDDKFFKGQIDKFITEISNYNKACVFGIEGPWGVGKTSFVNLVCKRLSEDKQNEIVIYKFNPLNYEDSNQVLKNFYTGLIAKIREEHFEPELESLLASYMDNVIAAVSEQNFYGVKFKFSYSDSDVENTIKKLEEALKHCQYKILVVIDDLDRLDFLTIKKIFFLMRNIFHFDNLQFIVCYDRENVICSAKINLGSENIDEERIIEFSDKYINRTYRLIFKRKKIRQYIQQLSKEIADSQNMGGTLWDSCVNAILNDCIDEQFFYYQKFFGTPRRIKKIFQQLVLILQDSTQVDTRFDFEGIDLVNLLLIYLYYPTDFKKLYYAETGTKRGTYSFSYTVVKDKTKRDDKVNTVKRVIKNLSPGTQFLFEQLFANETKLSSFSYIQSYRRACFNDSTFLSQAGTLERYLRLIVFSELPMENQLYSTYIRIINDDILSAVTLNQLFDIFALYKSEEESLWKAIISCFNIAPMRNAFSAQILHNLIIVAVAQINNYRLESGLSGFRVILIAYIKYFLNELARRNANQTVDTLLENDGVLCRLLYRDSNGPALMNLFDALYLKGVLDIRTESNDIFPLNNALIYAAEGRSSDGMNPDQMAKIELRTISQGIYHFFSNTFGNRNLWDEFNNLALNDVFEFNSEFPQEEQVVEQQTALFGLKLFILYQVGNPKRGLAGYDLAGSEDHSGIRVDFSQYLINQCFNIDLYHDRACFDFIEFMLISTCDEWIIRKFGNNQPNASSLFTISPEALISLIAPDVLKDYWLQNRVAIINNAIFDGKQFYVNQDTIFNARYVVDVIRYSLDTWTSEEQASRWNGLS